MSYTIRAKKLQRMGRLVGLILAKSQSNRLTNKNTLDFHGQPMFLVNTKKCLDIFDSVYVSSDSTEILKQAQKIGAIPILRNEDLCGDTPNILVYQHALQYIPKDIIGIVAVQANSPTLESSVITGAKMLLEEGKDEVMTCHEDRSIYGSVWGISRQKLENYGDPYKPNPNVTIVDRSIDVHTMLDYQRALMI